MYSGGGGLISSMRDYLVFLEMIRCGGRYEDAQILGRKTVELMLRNHLSGDMASMGQPTFSEMPMEGIGFGLGGAILLTQPKRKFWVLRESSLGAGWRALLSGLTPKKSCLLFL